MSSQYGELRPTNGWDWFVSLVHHSKFQQISRLGSITARHSSSGRQPSFAALNRGHHLYWAGRLSRWALAHILVSGLFQAKNDWLPAALCSAKRRYISYSEADFEVFTPQGWDVAPMGWNLAWRSGPTEGPLLHAKFHHHRSISATIRL